MMILDSILSRGFFSSADDASPPLIGHKEAMVITSIAIGCFAIYYAYATPVSYKAYGSFGRSKTPANQEKEPLKEGEDQNKGKLHSGPIVFPIDLKEEECKKGENDGDSDESSLVIETKHFPSTEEEAPEENLEYSTELREENKSPSTGFEIISSPLDTIPSSSEQKSSFMSTISKISEFIPFWSPSK
ncbi:MAG: hypothetical protein ACH350_04235 [Parachlamydiaceae bacterium]